MLCKVALVSTVQQSESTIVYIFVASDSFATPWTCHLPGCSVHGISGQVYWSGWPFPSPEDLSDPRIDPISLECPALAGEFLATAPPKKPRK